MLRILLAFVLVACSGRNTQGAPVTAPAISLKIQEAKELALEGENEQASRLIEEALTILGQGSPRPRLLARALFVRGIVRTSEGNYGSAVSDLNEALEVNEDPNLAFSIREKLGAALDYVGRSNEAETQFRQAERYALATWGDDSLEVLRVRVSLGVNLEFQGQLRESWEILMPTLQKLDSRERDPLFDSLSSGYLSLGSIAFQMEDHVRALAFYEKALNERVARHGEQHLSVAFPHHNLALVAIETGDTARAIRHAQAAVDIRARLLPEEHHLLRETEQLLVRIRAMPSEPED